MRIALTVVITLGILVIAGLVFIYSGVYNIAATKRHNVLVKWVFDTVKQRSVIFHAPEQHQIEASTDLQKGYQAFSSMCIMCHGSPTRARWEPARSMVPTPPELQHAAQEWSQAEITWIVEHGIKMSGMPAFGPTHSREEIKQIAAFVDTLPAFTVEEYEEFIGQLGTKQDSVTGAHEHEGH